MDFSFLPSAGWLDLSDRTKLRLTGPDRVRFLHGQVSNDVRALKVGETQYACVMTAKGKMCADVFIHADDDALLLDADPVLREELAARLERYLIADDVMLTDVTDELALFHVLAPDGDRLPALPGLAGRANARLGRTGTDFFLPIAERDALRLRLGAGEWSERESELVRIAAAVPRWALDLAPDTIPVEAGLEARCISYTKGCYLGQEVISRIKSIGQVNHRLVRLNGPDPLETGAELRTVTGERTGEVTSAIELPGGRGWLALGYVRRGQDLPGTVLRSGSGEYRVG